MSREAPLPPADQASWPCTMTGPRVARPRQRHVTTAEAASLLPQPHRHAWQVCQRGAPAAARPDAAPRPARRVTIRVAVPLARADGRAARAQVARKWDSSSEGEALDFSEQPEGTSGDSDGGGAAGAGAPTVDLTAKSRVDVDEEVEEEEEEDEEEEEEAAAGGAAGTAAAAAPGAPATGVSAPARALPLFPARRCPAQLARRFEQRSSRRGFWPDHEQCEAGFF